MRLSPRAVRDLTEIWRYTIRVWGAEQADAYEREALAACTKLTANPYIGAPSRFGKTAYRAWRFGEHRIVYRVSPREIVIVTIMHVRADAGPRLN